MSGEGAAAEGRPGSRRRVRPVTRGGAVRRLLLAGVLAAGALVAAAGPAAAHPALVSSEPGAGYAVTSAPREIVLSFSEPVTMQARAVVVRDARDRVREVRVTKQGTTTGGDVVRATPVEPLGVGAYEVAYRVVGQDGDPIVGTFAFGVATPVGTASTVGSSRGDPERVQPVTTLLRTLLFLGLALGLGGAYLAWRVDSATGGLPGVRPLLRPGALLALVGAAGLLVELGPLSRLPATVSAGGIGRLLGLQALLLALAAAAARRPARGAVAAGLLVLVALLEGVRAHLNQASGLPGAALTVTHLLAGALWLGGLVHVLRLARSWRSRPKAIRVAVETYARNALALFVAVSATGTVSALVLLPTADDWTGTTFGRLLLVKLAVFAVVVVLAVLARARLRRGRPASDPAPVPPTPPAAVPPARRPLGAVAAVESAVLAAVVLAAASVTTVTPARLVPASTLLAAPVGPTLRVAERARQVTVAAVVFRGRVDLRTEAPDDGRPLRVSVTARLATAQGRVQQLDLQSCGQYCWTGPAEWGEGINTLEVDVDAGRWEAGRVRIPVTWPAVPAPQLLARVQAAMGARTALDTLETVTSGFGVVVPNRSRRTGQQFLEAQPWAAGGATDAVLVSQSGRRTLLFALPALGYHFAMRLDDADRILSERIVTPNHVLTREYGYP